MFNGSEDREEKIYNSTEARKLLNISQRVLFYWSAIKEVKFTKAGKDNIYYMYDEKTMLLLATIKELRKTYSLQRLKSSLILKNISEYIYEYELSEIYNNKVLVDDNRIIIGDIVAVCPIKKTNLTIISFIQLKQDYMGGIL